MGKVISSPGLASPAQSLVRDCGASPHVLHGSLIQAVARQNIACNVEAVQRVGNAGPGAHVARVHQLGVLRWVAHLRGGQHCQDDGSRALEAQYTIKTIAIS
jgi:hypothetical protein